MSTTLAEKVKRMADLSASRAFFFIKGFSGEVNLESQAAIDWEVEQECWITGGILLVKDATWGDRLSLSIVDKNNIMGYGPETLLGSYVEDFYVREDSQFQANVECPYVALLPAGIFLRVNYFAVSETKVPKIASNLFSHIPRE